MRNRQLFAKALARSGGISLLDRYWGSNRLTVLAYHRIQDAFAPDFDAFPGNVSASPELFALEMEFVARHFNVISLDDLRGFFKESQPLPERPLLITFDDGYLDNYQNAFPVLKRHGFPAVIFLMTSRMEQTAQRPWWDAVAYYFHHTQETEIAVPLVGMRSPVTINDRFQMTKELLAEMKLLPENAKQQLLQQLPEIFEVDPPAEKPLFVTWEQVRELVAGGVACMPHTVFHPILTRISLEDVRHEIADSRDHVRTQTQQEAFAFAYPNGTLADYNRDIIRVLDEEGYELAFTLVSGPVRCDEVKQHPFEIARVFLGVRDTFEMFQIKVMGLPALRGVQYAAD